MAAVPKGAKPKKFNVKSVLAGVRDPRTKEEREEEAAKLRSSFPIGQVETPDNATRKRDGILNDVKAMQEKQNRVVSRWETARDAAEEHKKLNPKFTYSKNDCERLHMQADASMNSAADFAATASNLPMGSLCEEINGLVVNTAEHTRRANSRLNELSELTSIIERSLSQRAMAA